MREYGKIVSYSIAKMLNNNVINGISFDDYKYAGEGNVTVIWDNYLGTKEIEEGKLIDDCDCIIHGKYYYAPTYAEVIDWLSSSKHIIIELNPVFTYSTQNHVAYFYKVYEINDEDSKLTLLFEENTWFSTFEFAMNEILKKLIENKIIKL